LCQTRWTTLRGKGYKNALGGRTLDPGKMISRMRGVRADRKTPSVSSAPWGKLYTQVFTGNQGRRGGKKLWHPRKFTMLRGSARK